MVVGSISETKVKDLVQQRKIVHEITAVYSPESNGAAERLNRTLLHMARTIIMGMKTQQNYLWGETVHTTSFLRNRLLSKSSGEHKTPYEIIHGKRPRLKHVRTFGSRAYVQ